ncbi:MULTISPECIES: aliphatic sulfonate ABC transporter substrate-binding protein [Rhizobium/Agrobacterium group]|uniref:Putative aliphatic sulfonates-binding protein n=5 Tax=Rhizobium/Agrobacterium group TaxID=227290 RepID=A0A2Z2PP31_AGRFC|nr:MULTISPECIES: aliphatic sulfonate ABC transporter substrate-binding protein [Rhizobium/Agrobacterium group]OCJ08311.1 nitrate ABC transporter substrate-binding protein [Agrobacterium sp. B131/95]AAK91045.2 ABC transporter, substrate binding protein (nitrate/sulfonate) [Agrobacterium fabrum str. C58]ASK42265.1 nitrate ABC transporter substrate-binding protein [Agrobacterium sp.]ASK42619.1 nitrate ABC transporter substrate-binding protein [Agrobacterium fabrum str. C58]ASK43290.1 nitrate ABC 
MKTKSIIRLALSLALSVAATVASAQDVLRVGDQRGNARAVMDASGVLKDVPYQVEWSEFANAAPLLEALAAEALDAGSVGDAPLTFAAARGVKAKAIFATKYEGNAIIVKNDAPYQGIKDLVRKKVAFVKGSAGHALILQSLKEAGLKEDAITPVFLPPAEATLALTNGSVDAVSLWEPYISFATLKSGARIIVDGKNYPSLSYFIASEAAIEGKRDILKDFVARSAKARAWGLEHPQEYSKIIAQLVKIPDDVALGKQTRERHAPQLINADVEKLQQSTIDLYYGAGIIDKKLKASDLLDDSFSPKQTD